MKSPSFLSCLLAGALCLAPGLSGISEASDPAADLVEAASNAEVAIYTEELVVSIHGENTIALAPIQGFELIAAAGFASGVDMAFAYIDLPESDLPAGYYILRASAPEGSIQVGEYEGTVDFVDLDGEVVASLPGIIQTDSTTVPDPLPYPRPVLSASWLSQSEYEEIYPPAEPASLAVTPSRWVKAPSPKKPGLQSAVGQLFRVPDWINMKGWQFHYVFVRVRCPNGSIVYEAIPVFGP